MLLSDMKVNTSAVISSLNSDDDFNIRLMDLGFCVGEKVECVCVALMKSPILYRVKGCEVALRRSDAEKVEVIK